MLTDEEGRRIYAACLTFHEAVRPIGTVHGAANALAPVAESDDSAANSTLREEEEEDEEEEREAADEEDDEDEEDVDSRKASLVVMDPNLVRPADLYAPKSLVLISRQESFDLLKVCDVFPLVLHVLTFASWLK